MDEDLPNRELPDPDFGEPDFAPWDGRRVPVTLLGGYLGSGKTTVLNELLARTEQPIAVLVNEVGKVNIDAALIKNRNGDTIELTDGCICCDLKQGLTGAFDQVRSMENPPDHVVVELSGVAQPGRILMWANSSGFRLDGVVILVDTDQFLEQMSHEIISLHVKMQIQSADVLMLTKQDLSSADQIQQVRTTLEELAPGVPILTPGALTTAAGFLGLATRRSTPQELPALTLFDGHQVDTIVLPHPATTEELQRMLDALPPHAFRAKGIAVDNNDQLLLVEKVGRRQSITPLPNAEWQLPTDLVVISATKPVE